MRHPWSIARRIAAAHMLLVAVIAVFSVWVAYVQAREVALTVESGHVLGTASLLATDPAVRAGLGEGADAGGGAAGRASDALQSGLAARAQEGRLSWVSVLDREGVRVATTFPDQRGEPFPESVDRALAGDSWTELSLPGRAGPSVRALVPVRDAGTGEVLGVLAAGVQVSDMEILAAAQLRRLALTFAAVALAGILVAGFVARYLDRVTLGRGPEEIAEQFLLAEAAMDSVDAGIVVLSPDGRVRLANAAAARVLDGIEPGTAPAAAAPRVPEALAKALAAHPSGEFTTALGERVVVVQQRTIPPHGRGAGRRGGPATVPSEVLAAAALEGVVPAPAGTRVLTLHDRTDLQRLGDDLTVAHTLGAALRAQTHEHANQLHAALSLVESGRLEAAKAVLARHRRPTAAGDDVVAALLEAKAAQARERGVAFTQTVDLAVPAPLGPLDLLTVVGNLVDNAVDAAAGPEVAQESRWVDVEVVSDEAGLVVQAADGGPGPDPAAMERLFEQGFSTKPAGAAGRGMGLWLVRRLAEGAGGTVEVATDSGTVFRVEVPHG